MEEPKSNGNLNPKTAPFPIDHTAGVVLHIHIILSDSIMCVHEVLSKSS